MLKIADAHPINTHNIYYGSDPVKAENLPLSQVGQHDLNIGRACQEARLHTVCY